MFVLLVLSVVLLPLLRSVELWQTVAEMQELFLAPQELLLLWQLVQPLVQPVR